MKVALVLLLVGLTLNKPGNRAMEIVNEPELNFHISTKDIFKNNIQMYHALLDKDHSLLSGSFDSDIGF